MRGSLILVLNANDQEDISSSITMVCLLLANLEKKRLCSLSDTDMGSHL